MPVIMASQSEAANFIWLGLVETPVSFANLQFQTSQQIFTLIDGYNASYKVQFTGHFCAAGVQKTATVNQHPPVHHEG